MKMQRYDFEQSNYCLRDLMIDVHIEIFDELCLVP